MTSDVCLFNIVIILKIVNNDKSAVRFQIQFLNKCVMNYHVTIIVLQAAF